MELIDREKLKASIRSMVELPNEARAQVAGAINRAKAVNIVRCKECKECSKYPRSAGFDRFCYLHRIDVHDNDFCSFGERRTDG